MSFYNSIDNSPEKSLALKVPKSRGNEIIGILSRCHALRVDLQILQDSAYIYIPIRYVPPDVSSYEFEVLEMEFPRRCKIPRGRTFKDLLRGRIPDEVLRSIPRSLDIIGDIALIQLPTQVARDYGKVIGEAIMKVHRNVKAVFARGEVTGDFRVRSLVHIAGEYKIETIHKEHGVKILVDISKTYINPSLAEEHRRVSQLVRDNECVLDMFCGVGPFSLLIAHQHRALVIALDLNPHAIACLKKSIKLNKLRGEILALVTDSKYSSSMLRSRYFNHIIMNLPHKSLEFLDEACKLVKSGGLVHVYSIGKSVDEVINAVKSSCTCMEEVVDVRKVLDYAPHKYVFRVSIRSS